MKFQDTLPKVKEYCKTNGLTLIFACDNGSHSWGYDGPMSDWDIKFVYTHPRDKYLSLAEPLQHCKFNDAGIEYVGYDLKKFLGLLYRGNAAPYEFVFSTFQEYFGNRDADTLKSFTLDASQENIDSILAHYVGLAGTTLKNSGEPTLKKWCYVLRPLLMAEYIFKNKFLPVLDFGTLLDFCLIDKLVPLEIHVALDTILAMRKSGAETSQSAKLDAILEAYSKKRVEHWFQYLSSNNKKPLYTGQKNLTKPEVFDTMFRSLIK